MTFPINLVIGEIEISSHLLFEVLSFFIGFQYYRFRKKNYPDAITSENRIWIIIGAAAGAFLFSRLIGALEDTSLIFGEHRQLLIAFNNRTIVGGLIGGLLGVELVKKIIGERNSSGDLFTLPLIIAIIIGRVGCFFAGLSDNTYGNATSLQWGIDLGDGIKRHPTNLYEILFLIIVFILLWSLEKKRALKNGSIFKIFMVLYLAFRLLIDFIKPYEPLYLNLSSIQISCVIALLYYYRVIIFPKTLQQPLHA
jgi:phosphatidylglycerol---prolipoprotein diacylglyceryl transferase